MKNDISDNENNFTSDNYTAFKMETKIRFKKFILISVMLTLISLIYYGFFCSESICSLFATEFNTEVPVTQESTLYKVRGVSYKEILNDNFHFNMNAHDVIVFLHIQKTGGTSFGRHLVQDLDLKRPCTCQRKRKRCYCFRPNKKENWLFSRYSTGWKCGLHADWTELTNCVDAELDKNEGEPIKRRYLNG